MSADARATYDALTDELTATTEATTGVMFGMPCLKRSGKAFAGFSQGAMVFKLSGAAHAEALTLPGAHLFDPMGGRPMKEWVLVPAEHGTAWPGLARAALAYVGATH
jgi:hypothetical protein